MNSNRKGICLISNLEFDCNGGMKVKCCKTKSSSKEHQMLLTLLREEHARPSGPQKLNCKPQILVCQ